MNCRCCCNVSARHKHHDRGETILAEGAPTEQLGMVLTGMAMIGYDDVWGSHSLLGHVGPERSVCRALCLHPGRAAAHQRDRFGGHRGAVFEHRQGAHDVHERLPVSRQAHSKPADRVRGQEPAALAAHPAHTTPKGIRARLMSYFSECVKRAGQYSFDIPYNRQQLADYLGVDRSAMCSELSRMQREGLLTYHKNHFSVHEALE
ncbi:MAG: Crp/Fnr family transcriptional regulator [Oscillospiraceae bacterium]